MEWSRIPTRSSLPRKQRAFTQIIRLMVTSAINGPDTFPFLESKKMLTNYSSEAVKDGHIELKSERGLSSS